MILSELIKYNTIIGVDILIKGEHQYAINLVELKKNKGKLNCIRKATNIQSFEELKKHFTKNEPMMISISGRGIIHKKIKRPESDTPSSLMNSAMPGSGTDDFAYQVTEISDTEIFVSLIRNITLNSIIEDLKNNGLLSIVGCFLGPFAINNLLSGINEDKIIIPGSVFSIHNKKVVELISSAESTHHPVKVDNEMIPAEALIAMSTAFAWFSGDQRKIHSDTLTEVIDEFSHKRKFEVRKLAVLGILFFILVMNFLIFTSYADKNNELSGIYTSNASALQELDGLKKEYEFKKQFLEENDLLQHSRTSYYADMLAKDLPSSVRWSSLKINPLKTKTETPDAYYFENRIIAISGKTEQGNDLNQWMKKLRQYTWVSNVTLQNFTQDQKNEAGIFSLRIHLKQ